MTTELSLAAQAFLFPLVGGLFFTFAPLLHDVVEISLLSPTKTSPPSDYEVV